MCQGEAMAEGAGMRALSIAGNTLLLAGLGTTAYFGYYTARYTTPEMKQLIEDRKKHEQEIFGSSVSS